MARIHASSGTTGKPTVVGYTKNDLKVFAEVVARSLAAAGARPGMMLHNAYGYGLFTGGLGLHGGGGFGDDGGAGLRGDDGKAGHAHPGLPPRGDLLHPFLRPDPGGGVQKAGVSPEELSLEYAVLGAEPWTEAIRKQVDEGLGVKSTNIYGLSEIIGPGVSNECVEERQGSHIWEDHFLPEVVDPDTGEPLPEGKVGVLVFTTLTKEAMPLLRYWTGDLTFLTYEACTCGRTHVRMGPILGRTDDMLIIRGVNVYPTQVEAVLLAIPEVEPYYQIVVRREGTLDEAELKVEVSEPFFREIGREVLSDEVVEADHRLHALRERIARKIKDNVGVTLKVTLLPRARPRGARGKLRRVLDLRK